MVFGAVVSDRTITDPHFIETDFRLNTIKYLEILHLLPWIDLHFDRNAVVFIQDFAQCHKSKKTQKFLAEKLPFLMKSEI